MAINFTKDLPQDKLLMAFNNNVVRFGSDNPGAPQYCDIEGLGLNMRIWPDPNGNFYFNFEKYSAAIVNTNRFVDNLATDLVSGDSDTFTYDVTDGTYIDGDFTFTIVFDDDSTDVIARSVAFLAGVLQLEDFKRQEIPLDADYVMLSPVQRRSNNTTHLTFWEGYPFEFSFYTKNPADPFTLKNTTNGLDWEFQAKGSITSLVLSDGRTDVTIEDFLPLVTGVNQLRFIHDGVDQESTIFLTKADADCGVYIKWLNHLGRWNYFLLNKISFRDRSSKYLDEIDNDFSNLEDTFAPTVQTGKISSEVLKCNTGKLTSEQKRVLLGLLDSPKIYWFVGERYSRSSVNDWIEVSLKATTLKPEDGKKSADYNIDFDLPTRYMQHL